MEHAQPELVVLVHAHLHLPLVYYPLLGNMLAWNFAWYTPMCTIAIITFGIGPGNSRGFLRIAAVNLVFAMVLGNWIQNGPQHYYP